MQALISDHADGHHDQTTRCDRAGAEDVIRLGWYRVLMFRHRRTLHLLSSLRFSNINLAGMEGAQDELDVRLGKVNSSKQ